MRSFKLKPTLLAATAALAALAAIPQGAAAQDRPTDPSTIDILDVLVEKGVLSREDANSVLSEARKRAEANSGVVRVPHVPEAVRNQIRDEVKKEVVATARQEGWAQPDALPEWLSRFRFSGDMRVRGEHVAFGQSNTPLIYDINAINADGGYFVDDLLPLRATTKDRQRARVRARFGVDAKVSDKVEAGLRFVTGNPSDPVSTNESLTGNFDKFMVGLDRAYIRVRPFDKRRPLCRQQPRPRQVRQSLLLDRADVRPRPAVRRRGGDARSAPWRRRGCALGLPDRRRLPARGMGFHRRRQIPVRRPDRGEDRTGRRRAPAQGGGCALRIRERPGPV